MPHSMLKAATSDKGRYGSVASAIAIVTTVLSPIAVTLMLLALRV